MKIGLQLYHFHSPQSPDDIGQKVREMAETADQISALCREMAGLGVDHVVFNMPDAHTIKPVEMIGREVVPAVADVEAVKP